MAFAAKNGEGTPQEGPLLECMQEITPRLVFPTPAFACWEHHSEGSRGRQCVHEQNCRRPAKSVFYALRSRYVRLRRRRTARRGAAAYGDASQCLAEARTQEIGFSGVYLLLLCANCDRGRRPP